MAIEIPGYQIVRELGRGGMATVYLAIQESFGREVALKIMAPVLSADPNFHERFLREAQIVSRLLHPHIVTVYDMGEHHGHHFLSMEYVKGQDLRRKRVDLSLLDRLRVVKEVAAALEYAGRRGYVHRDVKPENIMLHDDGGRAVLMDFGIARAAESDGTVTQTGAVIGTPQYMSPEQAKGLSVDPRSDLYSLGVVLFQLLANRVPFHAESPHSVVFKQITEPVPRLPPKLGAYQPVIDRILAKDPEQRYRSGAELITALDQVTEAYMRAMRRLRASGVKPAAAKPAARAAAESDAAVTLPVTASRPAPAKPAEGPGTGPQSAQHSLKVPEDMSRQHRARARHASPAAAGILIALLVGAGLAAAGYYGGWLAPLLDRTAEQVRSLLEGGDGQQQAGSETAPSGPPAALAPGEAGADGVGSPASVAPQQPVAAAPEPAPPTLDQRLRDQAAGLLQRLESDAGVAPQLGELYRLALTGNGDDGWAREGLDALEGYFVQRVGEAVAAADLVGADRLLEAARSSLPQGWGGGTLERLRQQVERGIRLADLLRQAEEYLRRDALGTPAGANALEAYRAVLAMEPGHAGASAGIARVARRYGELALERAGARDYERAMTFVQRGLEVDGANADLQRLKTDLGGVLAQQGHVRDLLGEARMLRESGQLIEPEGRSAYDRYRRVLELDEGNADAASGLQAVERALAARIEPLLAAGSQVEAERLLAEARNRYPASAALLGQQHRLDEAIERQRQAELEASRPKVTRLLVSGQAIDSVDAAQEPVLRVGRTLHIGFRFRNFVEQTSVVQAVLYDGARSLQIAQVPVIVNGLEGVARFRIERPVEGFAEGGYNLDLLLEGERLISGAFKVAGG